MSFIMSDFTIAICTYNRYSYLKLCLDKLCEVNLEHKAPILVVDNLSTDNASEYIENLIKENSSIEYVVEKT